MKRISVPPAVRAAGVAVAIGLLATGVSAASRAATRDERVPAPPLVMPTRPGDVHRVLVESRHGRVELSRRRDGLWAAAAGSRAQSASLMTNVEDGLFPLGAYRMLAAEVDQPVYGLDDPEISLAVEDTGGVEHRVVLGAPSFTGGGFYAARSTDRRRVYLVPRRTMDDLRSLIAGKRIDSPNDIPRKARELREKAQAEEDKGDWLLRQVTEAGTPLPKGLG